MRKTMTTVLSVFALLGGSVALTAAPAQADRGSPKCMTKAEWRKIDTGMSRARVKKIVGINGRVEYRTDYSDGTISKDVYYRQCRANGKPARGSWNTVWLSYDNYEYDDDYDIYFTGFQVDYKGSWSRPF